MDLGHLVPAVARAAARAMRNRAMRLVPPSLDDVLSLAQSLGPQPGISWPRRRWTEAFPQHRRLLNELPDLLTREAVRTACAGEPQTPQGSLEAFIVCMAWGHGGTGYGVYRTEKVLALAGAEAGPRLAAARRAVIVDGPLAGYDALAGSERLVQLGPAFGTKYLFFQSEVALILDALTGRWFQHVTGNPLRPTVWLHDKYAAYLRQMGEWAEAVAVPASKVEQAAFQLMSERANNQWAP